MREWRRERRERAAAAVMDQRSLDPAQSGRVAASEDTTDGRNDRKNPMRELAVAQRCIECGRESRWVRPYPSRCWGRPPRMPLRC